jgi:uncharacterized protein (DUF169 family)
MTNIEEFNEYGEELENALLMQSSPVAVKMLEKESDIPPEAVRPKKERGYHIAQCQAFAMTRREKATVAMLTEDNWCPAAMIAYGLVARTENMKTSQHEYDCFEVGKYVGILTAPLKRASFKPDVVILYLDTNQLRNVLLAIRQEDRALVKGYYFPPSCDFAVVTPMKTGEYAIVLPDPGEYVRALTMAGEMMFSVPADRLAGLVADLRSYLEGPGSAHESPLMRPDFPRPDFYKAMFREWGLEDRDQ